MAASLTFSAGASAEGQDTAFGAGTFSAGGTHSCAIRGDGALACWGDDSKGQLDGIPAGTFTAVSAGGAHSCAIRVGGALVCWGDDSKGQLDGIPAGTFTAVSAGGAHTLRDPGRRRPGLLGRRLEGAGCRSRGRVHLGLGRRGAQLRDSGERAPGLLGRQHGRAGERGPGQLALMALVLARRRLGLPRGLGGRGPQLRDPGRRRPGCWGDDSKGQLDGIPAETFTAVSAGGAHTCAIAVEGGSLECWGDDSKGQLDGIPGRDVHRRLGGRCPQLRGAGHRPARLLGRQLLRAEPAADRQPRPLRGDGRRALQPPCLRPPRRTRARSSRSSPVSFPTGWNWRRTDCCPAYPRPRAPTPSRWRRATASPPTRSRKSRSR